MNKKYLLIALPFFIILAIAAQQNLNSNIKAKPDRANVKVAQAKQVKLSMKRTYPGTTRADDQSSLSFRIKGQVENIYVKPPETIEEGQVLARIDATDLVIKKGEIEAALIGAKAQSINTANLYERIFQLWEKGHATDQQLDDSEATKLLALSKLESLEQNLKMINQQISYTELKAPYRGSVSTLHVREGENIRDGQPILDIYPSDTLDLSVSVPENIIGFLSLGDKAKVKIPALGDDIYTFTITELSRAKTSRLGFPILLTLKNPPANLHPGLSAQVTFTINKQNSYLSLPTQALLNDFDRTYIYTINKRSQKPIAELKLVEVSGLYQDSILVSSGLSEEDLVVIEGQHLIQNHQEVAILSEGSTAL